MTDLRSMDTTVREQTLLESFAHAIAANEHNDPEANPAIRALRTRGGSTP